MMNKRVSRSFSLVDLLYKSDELDSDAITHYWSQQLLNTNEILQLHQKLIQKSFEELSYVASNDQLDAYYRDLVVLLSKNLFLPVQKRNLDPINSQRLISEFILIVHDCFLNSVLNYFLSSTDNVLKPIYDEYLVKVRNLRNLSESSN
ncbi:hypothetical protein [Polynucleobacter sp. MWH-Jannik1A5]|uniref:hypothetical protein n=1 Tax=Polynucleobacter sp. MWH-Jannik1A5 TaxID=1855890 RepID=UPI001C0C5CF0|nr:hypothetical protein [Polynucleobacter sp. MWH-Jannik1A5]MBU3545726.1 hypothetical protein [Polynucleobacter sp. MWH-Jannik1A5]